MNKQLIILLFNQWVDKNYPKFYFSFGVSSIILGIIFAASLISSFWLNYWWKISLSTLAIGGLTFVTFKLMILGLIDEFKNYNKK